MVKGSVVCACTNTTETSGKNKKRSLFILQPLNSTPVTKTLDVLHFQYKSNEIFRDNKRIESLFLRNRYRQRYRKQRERRSPAFAFGRKHPGSSIHYLSQSYRR